MWSGTGRLHTNVRERDAMHYNEFLTETVYGTDGVPLEFLKSMLSDMYVVFSFVENTT